VSVDAARRAIDWAGGTTVQRHVLLTIGVDGDALTDWANVGLERLARETGYSRSTVSEAVRAMVALGVLERRGSGGRKFSQYRVASAEAPATDRPGRAVAQPPTARQPPGNRPATARQPPGDNFGTSRNAPLKGKGKGKGSLTPLPPIERPASGEVVEVLPSPALAPDGAGGELALGRHLDEIIASASARRPEPISHQQAREARKIARDRLAAGWPPERIVDGLAECLAFTTASFDYADGLRRRRERPAQVPPERMSAMERSSLALHRALSGEDGKS
jgi:IclR helix-turn-helix domain